MAEPTNTPLPPGTPVPASTPRSSSPAPPMQASLTNGLRLAETPPPTQTMSAAKRPVVLHIGDPIKYNPKTYEEFSQAFQVIRPSAAERERSEFIKALKERRWGDFSAIFRPFWATGGEMGRWDAELIDLLPDSVRVFASAGAGFDWADTKLLGEKGIMYCNSGLAAAEAVADFAVAMVISTFRHLPWCINAATISPSSSSLSSPSPPSPSTTAFQTCHTVAPLLSHNPRNHVLGLVGLGNIGQQLAAKLGHPATFGMRVAYYDIERKSADLEARLRATYYPSLADLLAVADCVVLCVPGSASASRENGTRASTTTKTGGKMITAAALRHMKRGARFVNVARGSLVDEDALADALEDGRVGAAALDVHADEPRVNPRLVAMARGLLAVGETGAGNADGKGSANGSGRVLLTCHNAGGTVETHAGFEELSMRNIMAVLSGQEPITAVNLGDLRKR
ncbi:hypothetical protein VTK26DRAFT_7351 [Humicola hyalothermophila]